MKCLRIAFVVIAVLVFVASENGCFAQQTTQMTLDDPRLSQIELAPESKYEFAWNWIYQYYCDVKFNDQDWKIWKHRFDGKIRTQSEAIAAIDQMFASLNDPNVEFVPEFSEAPAGIGILLIPTGDRRTTVAGVIKDSPAARAGIHYGDVITQIDGVPIFGKMHDFVKKIRGPLNTSVRLQVSRNGSPIDFEVIRDDKDCNPESYCTVLNNNLAYLRPAFPMTEDKTKALKTAIASLGQANAKGLILDLRNSIGGFHDVAEVASFFIGTAPVGKLKYQIKEEKLEGKSSALTDLPMVVLIDRTTTQSAEVFAAGLKGSGRATFVGERTSGFGRVYREYRIDKYSSVYLPFCQFLTSDGTAIHGKGIEPDIKISADPKDVAKGPWWHFSKDGRAPSILTGSDFVLQRGITELSRIVSAPKPAAHN